MAVPGRPDPLGQALAVLATPVLVLDGGGLVSFANQAARALLGCEEAPGAALSALFASCGAEASSPLPGLEAAADAVSLRLSDGRMVRLWARPLPDGGAVLSLEDSSVHARDADQTERDPLTGLPTRAALAGAIDGLLGETRPATLFALGLDRFKPVNDTLGHAVGDALLRKVGERLGSLAQDGDTLARTGGDAFALLTPRALEPDAVQALAKRMADLAGRSYALEGHMIHVGASIGIACAPDDAPTGDGLIRNADLALGRAKAGAPGSFRFFEPAMDAQMQAQRGMEIDLRRALALKELHLAFQPQINLDMGAVVGCEALLRWTSPTRGSVSPAEFVPLAEETGMIVAIGEWVLRTACREAARWSQPITVAVNLSPLQFRAASLVQTVLSALANAGLPAHRLELEITEGALMDDTDTVVSTLQALRALGVRVSMDDFGTGYSSLAYLQKFPFDKIKIDQSFVRGMGPDGQASAIVRAVAALGASLGMKTTAEGVETPEQLAAIRAEGCTEVQGYLTGRPMPATDIAALLARAPTPTGAPATP